MRHLSGPQISADEGKGTRGERNRAVLKRRNISAVIYKSTASVERDEKKNVQSEKRVVKNNYFSLRSPFLPGSIPEEIVEDIKGRFTVWSEDLCVLYSLV